MAPNRYQAANLEYTRIPSCGGGCAWTGTAGLEPAGFPVTSGIGIPFPVPVHITGVRDEPTDKEGRTAKVDTGGAPLRFLVASMRARPKAINPI